MSYKVSIIVPVYNAAKYLKKCVDSLTGQTYPDLEILLIDDGSTDGSGNLCDALAAQDLRIKVVHKPNGGLISAWKAGVKESSGDYLCFVDSDDWLDTCMIADMAEHLTGNEREIIACDYIMERDDGNSQCVYQPVLPGEYLKKDMEENVIPRLLGGEQRYVTLSRCMKLIATKLIADNQKYCDEKVIMGEDVTVMLPSLIDCERLVIMDHKAYYHYLYVQESMVHKYNAKLEQNIELLIETTKKIVKDKFEGDTLKEQLYRVNQESIFWLFLVLKNEARGNKRGYRKNILKLCKSEKVRKLINDTRVTISQPANKLLYLVMKYPNHLTVSLLRMAMIWYYRR